MPSRSLGRIIPPGPADHESRLRSIERQLGALSRAPSMPETSQTGGSFVLFATDGTELLRFGDYNDADEAERYGVALFDTDGNIVLANDESDAGLVWPGENQQWGSVEPVQVTSASFVDTWSTSVVGFNGDAIYAQVAYQSPGGNSEVRIRWVADDGSSGVTNTLSALIGYNGGFELRWLHPFDVGLRPAADLTATYVRFYVEARRTTGAGTVNVYRPRLFYNGSRRVIPGAVAVNPLAFV